jgi:serine/threonine protein phosphatase PrpC
VTITQTSAPHNSVERKPRDEEIDVYGLTHPGKVRAENQDHFLTLYLGVWPKAYLLQVGDSRCYLLRRGELTQITRDQTMAEELVNLGVMNRATAASTRFANTLSSAIGGHHTAPVVTPFEMTWGNVVLLCGDGLTRDVPDERIRDRLRSMKSARKACEELLQDALDAGGSDNITIVIGRAVRADK